MIKYLGIIFILLSVAFALFQWMGEATATDMCLDSGGVYDYATSSCRFDIETLPYTGYTKRFGWELLCSAVVASIGALMVYFATRRSS